MTRAFRLAFLSGDVHLQTYPEPAEAIDRVLAAAERAGANSVVVRVAVEGRPPSDSDFIGHFGLNGRKWTWRGPGVDPRSAS